MNGEKNIETVDLPGLLGFSERLFGPTDVHQIMRVYVVCFRRLRIQFYSSLERVLGVLPVQIVKQKDSRVCRMRLGERLINLQGLGGGCPCSPHRFKVRGREYKVTWSIG